EGDDEDCRALGQCHCGARSYLSKNFIDTKAVMCPTTLSLSSSGQGAMACVGPRRWLMMRPVALTDEQLSAIMQARMMKTKSAKAPCTARSCKCSDATCRPTNWHALVLHKKRKIPDDH